MARSEITIDAYVIDVIQQKEADALVTFLTEQGLKKAYLRGMMRLKSRNYFLNNRFLKVKLTGFDQGDYFRLKEATLIKYPEKELNNYRLYYQLIDICKVMNQVQQVLDYASFIIFDYIMENVNETTISHYKLLFLISLLQSLHVNIATNCCAICGSTEQIVNFNLYQGGMVCVNCNEQQNYLNLEQLKLINEIYTMQISKFVNKKIEPKIMYDLIDYLNHGYGLNIKWE